MNHNQLIDDTLVKSAMERICANITEIFLHRLERISNGGGCCFENALVDFSEHITELKKLGWQVITIWECELKKPVFDGTINALIKDIKNNTFSIHGAD